MEADNTLDNHRTHIFIWIAIVVIGMVQCDLISKLDRRIEVLEQQGSDGLEEQSDAEAPDGTGSTLHDGPDHNYQD